MANAPEIESLINFLVQTVQQLDFDGFVQLTAADLSRQPQAYAAGAGKTAMLDEAVIVLPNQPMSKLHTDCSPM